MALKKLYRNTLKHKKCCILKPMFASYFPFQNINLGSTFEDDKKKWNELHTAATNGVTEIISALSLGFCINSKDKRDVTALMLAALYGKLQEVEYLLENGADPSLEDITGCNTLHCASQGGCPDIIELILSHLPDIESRNSKGSTALMIACCHVKLQAVKLLLKKGASPSSKDNGGWNSLHWASHGGDPEVIEVILSNAPDFEPRTASGSTPLMIAASYGRLQASKYLLDKGADPSIENRDGWNSLHFASRGGKLGIIEKILSYGVDIENRTIFGETPLMIAQEEGHTEVIDYLLSKGAMPD